VNLFGTRRTPLGTAVSQLSRNGKWDPIGLPKKRRKTYRSALELALAQISGLMGRFMGVVETLAHGPSSSPEPEENYMKGWGDDELDDLGP